MWIRSLYALIAIANTSPSSGLNVKFPILNIYRLFISGVEEGKWSDVQFSHDGQRKGYFDAGVRFRTLPVGETM